MATSRSGRYIASIQRGSGGGDPVHRGSGVLISDRHVLLRPPDPSGDGNRAAVDGGDAWSDLVAPTVAHRSVHGFEVVVGPSDLGATVDGEQVSAPVVRRLPLQVDVLWPSEWQVQPFGVLVTLTEAVPLPEGFAAGPPPVAVSPVDTLWGLLAAADLVPADDEVGDAWLAASRSAGPVLGSPVVPWRAEHRAPMLEPARFFGQVHAAAAAAAPGKASPNGWGCWICPWLC